MASSLKKSNTKKKSERAIKMAEEKRLQEEQEIERIEKQKSRNKENARAMIDSMLGVYGLFFSILSLLFFNVGIIFSLIGSILGFFGVKRTKHNRKDKMFYLSVAAVVIGVVSSVIWLTYVIYILLNS